MKAKGGERTIDQPFERAKTDAGAITAPWVDWKNLDDLRAEYPALFNLMPLPAEQFELFYGAGGTVLTPASKQALQTVLAVAHTLNGSDLVVTGYTDTVGTPQLNDALSLHRAEQVRQLLIQQGFPADRIEAAGRGERDLAIPTTDGVDEPRNRRVKVIVR